MASGTPVSELDRAQALVVSLDTGTLDGDGNPVVDTATVNSVNTNATQQQLYDFAYNLGTLTGKAMAGIMIRTSADLGPID